MTLSDDAFVRVLLIALLAFNSMGVVSCAFMLLWCGSILHRIEVHLRPRETGRLP